MKRTTEYFYRTSRGASAIKFDHPTKAEEWYRSQKEKHGDACPNMVLIKRTTTVKDEILVKEQCDY